MLIIPHEFKELYSHTENTFQFGSKFFITNEYLLFDICKINKKYTGTYANILKLSSKVKLLIDNKWEIPNIFKSLI